MGEWQDLLLHRYAMNKCVPMQETQAEVPFKKIPLQNRNIFVSVILYKDYYIQLHNQWQKSAQVGQLNTSQICHNDYIKGLYLNASP